MKLFKRKKKITKITNHDIALLTIGFVFGFLIVLLLSWWTFKYILAILG